MLVFLIILFFKFFNFLLKRREKNIAFAGIAFLVMSFSTSLFTGVLHHYERGSGYSKKMWVESETISHLKSSPVNTKVYSNGTDLAKLHLQQDFEMLPRRSGEEAIAQLIREVRIGKAQIVYFYEVNWRNYLISDRELKPYFDTDYFVELEDGVLIRNLTK